MKISIHLKSWHNIKRWARWRWMKLSWSWTSNGEIKVKRPKKMSEAEKTALHIFMKVLLDPNSKLYYDLHTQECYLRSEDATLYIFLEALNVKIINSVYGYDVHIGRDTEAYLLDRFKREMAIRRQKFKNEALSKIEHSLESTLNKLKNS